MSTAPETEAQVDVPPLGHPPGAPQLVRALGTGAAIAVVVGNVIGSGIFLKPGQIAKDGGDLTLIFSGWALGGMLCILGALCLAELATMLPRAGGLYVYLREAYGKPVAFLYGWMEFLFGRPGSVGALAMAFAGSMALVLKIENPSTLLISTCAVTLIAIMTAVNFVGVVWGGRLQTATTVLKAGGVVFIALLPWIWSPSSVPSETTPASVATEVAQETEAATGEEAVAAAPARPESPWARFGLIMLAIMWAYHGWHGITPVAEEVREPHRNIPIALFGGIGLLIVLYLTANIAYHRVLSLDELAAAGDHGAEAMARRLLGDSGAAIISAVIMCSTFGAINSNMLLGPRITFAMGRDDVFFRQLGRVHLNFHTPATAIVVQALLASFLIGLGVVLKNYVAEMDPASFRWEVMARIVETLKHDSIFNMLTNFVVFGSSIFFLLTVLAVFVLRRKHPTWARPYRTWGYPWLPAIFLLCYVWFLAMVYQAKPLEARIGLLLILMGLPIYGAWQLWGAKGDTAADAKS